MAQNKRAGKKSLAQNDFIPPSAPINVTATDVGTNRPYNNGSAIVSFSLPVGSVPATGFTVTASTGQTASGSSSPITVTGIPVGTVTFTVTGANANGVGTPSAASTGIAVTSLPSAPTGVTATSGVGNYDTVSWTAPPNGNKAITNYYITSSDGKTANTSGLSINIAQEPGSAQTYVVYADNANGRSGASSPSGSVTTFSFVPFSFTPYSFTPYSFTPYSFTPYGFTPVFGFTPYAFTPYGFVPGGAPIFY